MITTNQKLFINHHKFAISSVVIYIMRIKKHQYQKAFVGLSPP